MSALFDLAAALALTVSIECGAAALLLRSRHVTYAVLLGNLLTNPLLNGLLLLADACLPGVRPWALLPLELAATVGEGALLRRLSGLPARRADPLSLLLNALSFGAGLLLWNP